MAEYAVVNKTQLDADMTSVADTIRTKGGTTEQLAWPDGYKAAVEAIQTGGGAPVEVEEKDVNFYDYDGTLLYSYTLEEAQALTELPHFPSHEGLICQGWNWSLEKVTALRYPMDIGAMYTTDDGKSRFYLDIPKSMTVSINFYHVYSKNINIDWGDGVVQENLSGNGYVSFSHDYAPGKYVLQLWGYTASMRLGVSSGVSFLGGNDATVKRILYRVELGDSVSVLYNAFGGYPALKTISMPEGVKITNYTFSRSGLRAVIVPYGTVEQLSSVFLDVPTRKISFSDNYGSFGASFCQYAYVERLSLPEGVTELGGNSINGCRILTEVNTPGTLSSIGARALGDNNALCVLRFLATTPPTVANANAFTGIPGTCVVEVPAESLEAYQNATNYSGIAAQMVGV